MVRFHNTATKFFSKFILQICSVQIQRVFSTKLVEWNSGEHRIGDRVIIILIIIINLLLFSISCKTCYSIPNGFGSRSIFIFRYGLHFFCSRRKDFSNFGWILKRKNHRNMCTMLTNVRNEGNKRKKIWINRNMESSLDENRWLCALNDLGKSALFWCLYVCNLNEWISNV